jgi:hypothetical protein
MAPFVNRFIDLLLGSHSGGWPRSPHHHLISAMSSNAPSRLDLSLLFPIAPSLLTPSPHHSYLPFALSIFAPSFSYKFPPLAPSYPIRSFLSYSFLPRSLQSSLALSLVALTSVAPSPIAPSLLAPSLPSSVHPASLEATPSLLSAVFYSCIQLTSQSSYKALTSSKP